MALKTAVFISGGGTTLRNLISRRDSGHLPVDFRLVLSSSASAGGLRYATEAGITQRVVTKSRHPDPAEYSEAMFAPCREAEVDLVVMGGFLKHVLIPADFENRVVNIHPGLIPAFCGKGMYGRNVHQGVLDYGAKVSGCTVHFVDNDYDHGPIIAQRTCNVHNDDTADSLAARVFELECELLPEVITAIAEGRVSAKGRRVEVSENKV